MMRNDTHTRQVHILRRLCGSASDMEIQPVCNETKCDGNGDCMNCGFGLDDTADDYAYERTIELIELQMRSHARELFDLVRKLPRNCEGVWVLSYDSIHAALHDVNLAFVPLEQVLEHDSSGEVLRAYRSYDRERQVIVWVRVHEYQRLNARVPKQKAADGAVVVEETDSMRLTVEDEIEEGEDACFPITGEGDNVNGSDDLEEDLDALEQVEVPCFERVLVYDVVKLTELARTKPHTNIGGVRNKHQQATDKATQAQSVTPVCRLPKVDHAVMRPST